MPDTSPASASRFRFRTWQPDNKTLVEIRINHFNEIVMQSTGLLDKNGTEIYEGDIIRLPQRVTAAVSWSAYGDGEYVNRVQCWMTDEGPLSDMRRSTIEVIGNIYENPELLS